MSITYGIASLLVGVIATLYGVFGNTEVVAHMMGQYGPGVDEGVAIMFIVFGTFLSVAGVALIKR